MRTRQLQRAETPGDPIGVSNTTETLQLNLDGPGNRQVSSPNQPNIQLYVGAIIESEPRPTGVQLKRTAKEHRNLSRN